MLVFYVTKRIFANALQIEIDMIYSVYYGNILKR